MRHRLFILAVLLAVLTLAAPAGAWSYKEHILVTRLAVQRLLADPQMPEEMKQWLRQAAPTAGDAESARELLLHTHIGPEPQGLEKLDYWAIFPDIARQVDGNQPVAPFGVPEAPMHFIDLELLMPGDDIKQYRHDLSNKPTLQDIPRDPRDPRLVQAGYLPWRVEQIYDNLVQSIRQDRLMPTGEKDRDNALVQAGMLAHYLADNTQPHHATIDYRSASYFAHPRQAPNVHGMFEYGMLDWEGHDFPQLRERLWEQFQETLKTADKRREMVEAIGTPGQIDPWESTVRVSLMSYDHLPFIGVAAQKAAGQAVKDGDPTQPVGAPARGSDEFDVETFFRTEGEVDGQPMALVDLKARQLALATLRIEALLHQAWLEAQKAPASRPATDSSN